MAVYLILIAICDFELVISNLKIFEINKGSALAAPFIDWCLLGTLREDACGLLKLAQPLQCSQQGFIFFGKAKAHHFLIKAVTVKR